MKVISQITMILVCMHSHVMCTESFKLGLENIPAAFVQSMNASSAAPYRVDLITNQTGKDQQGKRNIDLLRAQGMQVTKIFAPEHGYSGKIGAEREVKDGKDRATGISIV